MADGKMVVLPEMQHIECKTRDALVLLAAGNTAGNAAKILNRRYPEDDPITASAIIAAKANHPEDYMTAVEWYADIKKTQLRGIEQAAIQLLIDALPNIEAPKNANELKQMVGVINDLDDVINKIQTSDKPGKELQALGKAESTLKALMEKTEEKNEQGEQTEADGQEEVG